MMLVRAIHGEVKNAGFSQPSHRAKFASGPKRFSMIDLPIIQLTATGLSMNGSRKATRKNLRAADVGVEQQREAEGDRVLDDDGQHIEDHVAERVPEIGIAPQRAQIVEAVEMMAATRALRFQSVKAM